MTKKRGLLIVLMMALMTVVFSISICAADITIEYYNESSIDTSANGGVQTIQAGSSVTLPKKTVTAGRSSNWYTTDGRAYSGGDKVTFYESVKLYHMDAVDVDNAEDLKAQVGTSTSWGGSVRVRLVADIEVDTTLNNINWSNPKVLLNGHTITFTSNVKTAFSGQRGGIQLYGSGTINLLTEGSDITFAYMASHGYAGDYNYMTIGRDVYVNAPHAVLMADSSGDVVQGHPYAKIYGTVNVRSLISMGTTNNKKPRVEVFEQGNVILSGPAVSHTKFGNTAQIIVNGGTINSQSTSDAFFADGSTTFMIKGGAFNFAAATDYDKLNELLLESELETLKKTVNNKEYTVVVPKECEHKYGVTMTVNASCLGFGYQYNVCTECENSFVITYGEKLAHKWYVVEHKDATKVKEGYDKYACETCYHSYYDYITYDPRNLKVNIIVKTSGGEKTVETTLGSVYEVESPTKSEYVIVGVKGFGNYGVESVYGISVPWGITGINITTANSYVGILTFEDASNLVITSIKGLSALHTINLERTAVRFLNGSVPSSITTINSNKAGTTVTFDASSFKNITSLTAMTMATGSTYTFGANSFQNTGFEKLVFPDNSTVIFQGQQAFYGCKNLKSVYIGKGITQLNNKPFDCCGALELAVLMDIIYVSDYSFCASGSGENAEKNELRFYSHSSVGVSIDSNAFANRNTYGVKVYMASSNKTSFNSCKYELHYGIPHAYTLTEIAPTCTSEGANAYVTDCPCNDNKSAIYKLYKSGNSDYEIVEMITEKIEKVPHVYENVGKLTYPNGFDKNGIAVYQCSVCHSLEDKENASLPMVSFTGYSVSESKALGMVAGIRLDSNMIKLYEEKNNVKLEYGMVLAASKVLNGQNPLDASGNAISKNVFKLDMSDLGYYDSHLKLANLSANMLETEFVLSGYIKLGDDIIYVQGNGNLEKPSSVTYNSIVNMTAPVAVNSKEN